MYLSVTESRCPLKICTVGTMKCTYELPGGNSVFRDGNPVIGKAFSKISKAEYKTEWNRSILLPLSINNRRSFLFLLE